MNWRVGQRVKLIQVRRADREKFIGSIGFIKSIGPYEAGHVFDDGWIGRNSDCRVDWICPARKWTAVCFWQLEPLKDLTIEEGEQLEEATP